jgi:DUF2905 family protein
MSGKRMPETFKTTNDHNRRRSENENFSSLPGGPACGGEAKSREGRPVGADWSADAILHVPNRQFPDRHQSPPEYSALQIFLQARCFRRRARVRSRRDLRRPRLSSRAKRPLSGLRPRRLNLFQKLTTIMTLMANPHYKLIAVRATLCGTLDRHPRTVLDRDMSRFLIILGLGILLIGIIWAVAEKAGIGRLPGDLVIRRDNFTFYFPIMTCILLSLVISLVMWLFQR